MALTLATLLLASTVACQPAPDGWPHSNVGWCPQVYRIQGSAPVHEALNIVILPAGFSEEDLPDFRCAASLMFDKLMTIAPFDRYACAINVYRVDLADPQSGIALPDECGGRTCTHHVVDWLDKSDQCQGLTEHVGTPMIRPDAELQPQIPECTWLDLDVRACPDTAPACRVIWPSGEGLRKGWRAATCAPSSDVVVIIANTSEWAGGGMDDDHIGLAVVTLDGIDRIGTRSDLLAHELGHALGLLDEYQGSGAQAESSPDFHGGRNIVRANPDGSIDNVPWEQHCTNSDGEFAPCKEAPRCGRNAAGRCGTCRIAADYDRPIVGLIEGGYYSRCGYYRASYDVCRMESATNDEFCRACRHYLTGLFEDIDMRPCALPDPAPSPVLNLRRVDTGE